MKTAQHHIRKQLLDFDFKTKSAALKWQQNVAFQYPEDYAKKIEAVLNKYDDGSCIVIDKLVVDLGTVSEKEIGSRLAETLHITLKNAINSSPLQDPQHTLVDSEKAIEVSSKSEKLALVQVFLYFMSQGHFPWYFKNTSVADLEEQLLQNFTFEALNTSLQPNSVLDVYWQKIRFYNQFSNSFVQEIVQRYFQKHYSILNYIADFCETKFKNPSLKSQFSNNSTSKKAKAISRWILLISPENKAIWAKDFTIWYVTKNCLSKTLLSNKKIWISLNNFEFKGSKELAAADINKWFTQLIVLEKEDISTTTTINENEAIDHHFIKREKQDSLKVTDANENKNETSGAHQPNEIKDSLRKDVKIRERKEKPNEAKNDKEPARQLEDKNETIVDQKVIAKDAENKIDETDEKHTNDIKNDFQREALKNPDKKGNDEAIKNPKKTNNKRNTAKEASEHALGDSDINEKASTKEPFENSQKDKNNPATPFESDTEKNISATNSFIENPLEENISIESANKNIDNTIVYEDVKYDAFYSTVEETIDTHLPPEKAFDRSDIKSTVLPQDFYYINDSGLILVWPYLSRLFKNVNYTENNQFVSKKQQERAIMLLGYIATGKSNCEEHELVFSKFLCNWPFTMPLLHPFEITKKEREEVKSMLNGLIGHWSILKNTSIDGLRETFFWREGKLHEKEDFWKLVVAQKGTDILLNHLPYGISMIKLPWHKKMLRVDWA